MDKIRRGGYVSFTWCGDHSPRHVDVYRDGQFVVKRNLENGKEMLGKSTRRIRELVAELEREGRL